MHSVILAVSCRIYTARICLALCLGLLSKSFISTNLSGDFMFGTKVLKNLL